MVPKADIEFVPVTEPITEPVTKFGGQPVWVEEPQWPISRSKGRPMQFICQIALDKEIFGDVQGQMAYIFITDTSEDNGHGETWEPDGGENAVIIQPSPVEPHIEVQPLQQGPSLYKSVHVKKQTSPVAVPCELAVKLQKGFDPPFLPDRERTKHQFNDDDSPYWDIRGNKIGGIPGFYQHDQLPYKDWKLLLELGHQENLFWLNFGWGSCYAFINSEGTEGKFLWQR